MITCVYFTRTLRRKCNRFHLPTGRLSNQPRHRPHRLRRLHCPRSHHPRHRRTCNTLTALNHTPQYYTHHVQ